MKRLLFLISFLAVSSMAMAQVNGGLQGPAAKNYKYWLDKNKPVATEVVTSDQQPLQGPAAKNTTWQDRQEGTYNSIEINSDRPQLIGPKAKATKPSKYSKYSGLASNNDKEEQVDLTSTKEP